MFPLCPAYTETRQITVGTGSTSVSIPDITNQVLLTNVGTNVVFVRLSNPTVNAAAQLNVDVPILPNSAISITRDVTHTVVAAIAAAAGNTLHVTPVQGF